MKALIITGRLCQDQELIYPMYRLDEAGYDVDIAAEKSGEFFGVQGVKFKADMTFDDVVLSDYDVLIIPGGVKCMEHMRLNAEAVRIVAAFEKTIGCICSGAQMLISARRVRDKKISAYYAMRDDVENAGAEFTDAPAVVDGNIVTSPHYKHAGPWMAAVLKVANG